MARHTMGHVIRVSRAAVPFQGTVQVLVGVTLTRAAKVLEIGKVIPLMSAGLMVVAQLSAGKLASYL